MNATVLHTVCALAVLSLTACATTTRGVSATDAACSGAVASEVEASDWSRGRGTLQAKFSGADRSNLVASGFEAGEDVRSWPRTGPKLAVFAWGEVGTCEGSLTLFLDRAPRQGEGHLLSSDSSRLLYVERCGDLERTWVADEGTLHIDSVSDEGLFSFTIDDATMIPNGASSGALGSFVANAVGTSIGLPAL